MMDFLDMDAVKRVERIADNVIAGRDLGLTEIYSSPADVFLLHRRELQDAFAMDLHRLVMAAKQGNQAMRQFVEWQSLQPNPMYLLDTGEVRWPDACPRVSG